MEETNREKRQSYRERESAARRSSARRKREAEGIYASGSRSVNDGRPRKTESRPTGGDGRTYTAERRRSPEEPRRRNPGDPGGARKKTASSEALRRRSPEKEKTARRKKSTITKLRVNAKSVRKPKKILTAEEKQRILKRNLIIAGSVVVAVILWYCIVANSYRNRFLPHTYINGFDMGKMSAGDAEAVLKKSVETYELELGFRGGGEEVLTSKDVNLTYVSSNEVEKILSEQHRASWIKSAFGKRSNYAVSTSFHFDTERMRSYLESLPEFKEENITKPQNAAIVRRVDNTYVVKSEVDGNEPNEDAVFDYVDKAINASETRLNLAACEDAYVEPSVRVDDEDLQYTVERFNSLVNCNVSITTRDGNVRRYGRDTFADWITYNEETGTWGITKEELYTKCWAIMQGIADEYDEEHTVVSYNSTYSGVVVLPCRTFGYVVDIEYETDKMYEALLNRQDIDIEITNSVKEDYDPKGGGTYIEVDVTEQVLTYYKNSEKYMEMGCVTGRESYVERRTPSGVYSILDKETDKVLGSFTSPDPGQRYESHVDVWMPFFESYGLHDASWRENFGGSWYLQYGSHGCVNLPPSEAVALFKDVEIGTPVIVLRAGDNAPEG
ncbi:MAG: L,D-transpeptidase family protein, partial [Lachnospiraceae bacterium]|nr:L,D-transpeptidase family protein [Lachnospiraceae bacterium]